MHTHYCSAARVALFLRDVAPMRHAVYIMRWGKGGSPLPFRPRNSPALCMVCAPPSPQSVYRPYAVQYYQPLPDSGADDDKYGSTSPGYLVFSDNQGEGVR
jgi:hypothetical protein